METIIFRLIALLALALLAGCQNVQTTSGGAVGVERSQYMFLGVSAAEIEQQYAKSYQDLLIKAEEKNLLDYESKNAERVDTISERLIKQAPVFRADAANWNWQIALIKDDTINANCGPGGKIIVYTGIIEKLQLTDDELAAVIGHEIAHALREHSREAISKAYPINVASQIGSLLGYANEVELVNLGVGLLMTLPNSRQNENEADLIGLELAARAGYNPNAAVTLWQKMAAKAGGAPLEFLSTHPSSENRINNLQAVIPKVLPLYQRANKH
ncbi:peptidase M48 [Ventosimonas gracilis]|uniref:Peptidase M48 n=1 Tax=Ventosimonas gracilis TaxID=1680762 RepID=A0A139SVC6_9GAMM|nr:M48 family metallopeptidase [Ventosimonas gracilis]KXU38392.1 peptidase M48 [Ventosimonas gracilis]